MVTQSSTMKMVESGLKMITTVRQSTIRKGAVFMAVLLMMTAPRTASKMNRTSVNTTKEETFSIASAVSLSTTTSYKTGTAQKIVNAMVSIRAVSISKAKMSGIALFISIERHASDS